MNEEQVVQVLQSFNTMLAKLEAKVENQEQLLALMTSGYTQLTALVEATVEHLGLQDQEDFGELILEKHKEVIKLLGAGAVHGEDQSNKFVPADPTDV